MIKILGTTNEFTVCELCGKKELKKTIVLDIDGEIVHYGSECASRATTGKKGNKKAANSAMRLAIAAQYCGSNKNLLSEEDLRQYCLTYRLANVYNGKIWNDFGETSY